MLYTSFLVLYYLRFNNGQSPAGPHHLQCRLTMLRTTFGIMVVRFDATSLL
eukprot:m.207771 g.207771  ORF g.207771 m.207771 type:complete len:51 (+) comp15030_c1_seq1:2917-3069(+)